MPDESDRELLETLRALPAPLDGSKPVKTARDLLRLLDEFQPRLSVLWDGLGPTREQRASEVVNHLTGIEPLPMHPPVDWQAMPGGFPILDGANAVTSLGQLRLWAASKVGEVEHGKSGAAPGINDAARDDAPPEWSKPDGPKQWARVFGFSVDTLMRRFRDGMIRHKKFSSKSYSIHVDDLPKPPKHAGGSPLK